MDMTKQARAEKAIAFPPLPTAKQAPADAVQAAVVADVADAAIVKDSNAAIGDSWRGLEHKEVVDLGCPLREGSRSRFQSLPSFPEPRGAYPTVAIGVRGIERLKKIGAHSLIVNQAPTCSAIIAGAASSGDGGCLLSEDHRLGARPAGF
eukprot:TRINITY_DN40924_c0_g2_i2.p1 TRINITY_DN40924_c0_g2~~TRINITY_DN40924_c0_g2_i2.p1  ORF type:complete len:150 (-),score=27.32 TRINITY_DN40924_c0_g2_i2:674-1123(-)